MDQLLAKLLMRGESTLIAVAIALILAGALIGGLFLTIRPALRRIPYLWSLAILQILLTASQFGWLLLPDAAEAGLFSVAVISLFLSFALFGAALYYVSAARSKDICRETKLAWIGFAPLANLWLLCKRGQPPAEPAQRGGGDRPVINLLKIVAALAVMLCGHFIAERYLTDTEFDEDETAKLLRFFGGMQTLENAFAEEAALTRAELPIWINEVTSFVDITAEGDRLNMIYQVDQDEPEFEPDLKQDLAQMYCAPDMFEFDIARGGRLLFTYLARNGEVAREFAITRADCDAL